MAKTVKIKTAHGTKVFLIKRSKVIYGASVGGKPIRQRQYMIMDSTRRCLALMSASTEGTNLRVAAVEVDGKFREYQYWGKLGEATTHEKMFAKIIKRVARRAA